MPTPRRLPSRAGLAVLLAALVATTTACFTGSRPTLGDPVDVGGAPGSSTTDASVDDVVVLLESAGEVPFTARYRVTRKLGSNTTEAAVTTDGIDISTTIGDVRFLQSEDQLTCSVSGGTCEEGILEARVSDYSTSSSFWGQAPARALRVAAERRSGDTTPSTRTIGGQEATCVEVPVGGGVETYCALPDGPVALWDTAATRVELLAFDASADPDLLAVPEG